MYIYILYILGRSTVIHQRFNGYRRFRSTVSPLRAPVALRGQRRQEHGAVAWQQQLVGDGKTII
jgi:uncharacterized membrane protein